MIEYNADIDPQLLAIINCSLILFDQRQEGHLTYKISSCSNTQSFPLEAFRTASLTQNNLWKNGQLNQKKLEIVPTSSSSSSCCCCCFVVVVGSGGGGCSGGNISSSSSSSITPC